MERYTPIARRNGHRRPPRHGAQAPCGLQTWPVSHRPEAPPRPSTPPDPAANAPTEAAAPPTLAPAAPVPAAASWMSRVAATPGSCYRAAFSNVV